MKVKSDLTGMYDAYVEIKEENNSCLQQLRKSFSIEYVTTIGSRLEDRKALRLAQFKQ